MSNDYSELIARLCALVEEYESLIERWKEACDGSQEVANLHATFKARERETGKAFERGDIRLLLDALTAQAATIAEQARELEALRADAERWRHARDIGTSSTEYRNLKTGSRPTMTVWHLATKGSDYDIDAAIDAAIASGKAGQG